MSEIVKHDPSKEPLDNTIQPVSPGFFLADNGRVATEFYQSGNEVVFVNKSRRISWTPNDMRYIDEFGMEDTIYTVQEVPLETKGNYARYNRAMPDVDDWFIVENDRLKHQILVQGFQPEPSPWLFGKIDFAIGGKMRFDSDLRIVADGKDHVNPFETHGGIQLYDGNELIFELPQIVAFDSAYDRAMTFGKYRVWFNDNAEMMFDIIVDNAWITSLDRVYPIVIDPTVIVNSGYSTAGNGGRKGVELSNGWLVTALFDSVNNDILFYKSTDKGTTWLQLCFIDFYPRTLFAIASNGNNVYCLWNGANESRHFNAVDATSQANVNIYANRVTILSNPTSLTNGGNTLFAEPNGKMHASWSEKSSTYPNSNNIRYASSTDGGATWSAVEQVTSRNSTGLDFKNPSITLKDGVPIVIAETVGLFLNGTSATTGAGCFSIVTLKRDNSLTTGNTIVNSSWSYKNIDFNSSSYAQSSPCTVVDKNGVIHVVWQSTDLADSNVKNIAYSKSTDGGVTWSTRLKLTSGSVDHNLVPTISENNGKLYVFWQTTTPGNNLPFIIKQIIHDGSAWSPATTVSGTTSGNGRTNPNAFLSVSNIVAFIYQDAGDSTVKFDKITLNAPPNAPTGLTRSNFDATGSTLFSWSYSDPDPSDSQSAYQLQIKDVATSLNTFDSGKTASTTASRTLASGTLTNGKQYQWRVLTWDSSDTQGVWSDYATFYTSAKPTAMITNITDGQPYSLSSLTIEWSMSDPESEGQSAYQVKLTDLTDVVLYDSGKVTNAVARAKTIEYTLANNTSYKTKLTVWDGKDVGSVEDVKTINVEYTPPATPTLAVSNDSQRGTITVAITHPTPVLPQPNVQTTEIFRRKLNETTWVRLSSSVGSSFVDYTPASGVTYEYKVKATGDNGTSVESAVVSGSVTVKDAQIALVSNPSVYVDMVLGARRNEKRTVERNLAQFAGRKDPVTYFGEHDGFDMSLTFLLFDRTTLERLRDLVDLRETLLYRDNFGRKAFVSVGELDINDESHRHYSVSVPMTKTSYTEEV
jgi:hypothetical protein